MSYAQTVAPKTPGERDASERTADARGGDQARQRRGDEAAKPQGEAARRRGDEATRRRDETARRRDDDGDRNDAQANDDQNGIEQATVGPNRGFRLKQRGNDTNSDGEVANASLTPPPDFII